MDDANPFIPEALRNVLPAARWESVNVGESGDRVYRSSRHVLKVRPRDARRLPSETLFAERERLRWLRGRVPVPGVAGYHSDAEAEYLAMERVRGIDMSHPDAVTHARRNTDLLARALRELHALPVRDCPFDASLRVRLHEARLRAEAGLIDEDDFDEARLGWTARDVLAELARTRPEREDLVVTHGDACLPNVIVSGEYVEGFVDVGRLGVADRHVDLALATRSLTFNYGAGYAELFLDTYGRALVDPARIDFYRLLDETV
ncbi:APH(3') family aminoglycoside O-phosphotransferase [Deinococcus pimensis]|uniref:APH(3') family aminoglycoside O-phosphotransferase n=1 Tax=Deinococcus pimensis TaxID=309888 RepID=UPI00047F170B|nr:APH(3') family aminoglycoside O-phosphotransferase [Deinococcus pimensis]